MDVDLTTEPIGQDPDGNDVYLRDLWPSSEEIDATIAGAVSGELFRGRYADVFTGDETWRALEGPVQRPLRLGTRLDVCPPPPYFDGMSTEPGTVETSTAPAAW
jgi:aconitate hydratase